MPYPYRYKKSGIWKLRGDIPPDVRPLLGQDEYRRSLGVREARDVKAAQARVMLALEAEWEAAGRGPHSPNASALPWPGRTTPDGLPGTGTIRHRSIWARSLRS
jgi:hypothetical protein